MTDTYDDPHMQPGLDDARPESNTLGIVGFVLAFCISPLGLLLSLVALAKPPRGFAIGGVVVGLLGTGIWGVFAWLGFTFGPDAMKASEAAQDYQQLDQAVTSYQGANDGALPADLSALNVGADALEDPWGNQWRLEPGADGAYTLRSAGFDGEMETEDDFAFEKGMSEADLSRMIQDVMEAHYQERFGG